MEYSEQNNEMRLVVAVGHRRETSLLSTILPRLPVVSKLVSLSFRTHCLLKYQGAKKPNNPQPSGSSHAAGESEARPPVPGMHRMGRAHGVAFSASASCSFLLPVEPSQGSPLAPAALRTQTIRSGFFQHLPDSFRQRGEWQLLCLTTVVTLPLRMGSRILHAEVWLLSHLLKLAALPAKTMHNPSFFLFSAPWGNTYPVSLITLPREAGRQGSPES